MALEYKAHQKVRKSLKETNREVVFQTLTLITSAFAFVAALAWNDAIKALIDRYFPASRGIYSHFSYAIIVTVVLVLATRHLGKLSERFKQEEEQEQNQNEPTI